MPSFYLQSKITDKTEDEVERKVKTGIFHYEIRSQKKYFVICTPNKECAEDVAFEIEVNKKTFNQLKIGDKVGLHVKVEFEYCCFYSIPSKKPAISISGKEG